MNKLNDTSKKLSILVPSYNDAAYIEQCISSILDSRSNNFEIIVSDDCSDSETLKILDKFHDSRLTILKSDVRLGAIDNWKKCLKFAKGDWFHFLASDDYYSHGAVDSILKQLKNKDTVYLVEHKCFDDLSGEIFETQCNSDKVNKIFKTKENVDWSQLLNFFNHDELVLSIFPQHKSKALLNLSKYSIRSSFMYWVLAIFYKTKISFILNCSVMKRYNHILKRAQWGETINKKSVLGFTIKGFMGDLYNSWKLSAHFSDLKMLVKLFLKSRFHGSHKGGLYGLSNNETSHFWPGPLLNILLSPIIIVAKKLKNL